MASTNKRTRSQSQSRSQPSGPSVSVALNLVKPDNFEPDEVQQALNDRASVKPLAPEKAGPGFSKLGGLDPIINQLKEAIQLGVCAKGFYNNLGVPVARNFMIHGPSGVGKSALGLGLRAYASTYAVYRLAFFQISDDHQDLCAVFDSAKALEPAIVLMDPVEYVCATDARARTLIKQIDGLANEDCVFVVGITRQLLNINQDLLTCWRFGITLELTIPTDLEKREIFTRRTAGWSGVTNLLTTNIMGHTNNWTGSQICTLCKYAAETALKRCNPQLMVSGAVVDPNQVRPVQLTLQDFHVALARVV